MTAQELMTPRFEVIANYPKMMYSLNQILHCTSEYQSSFFSEFPHLFKKLNWWEYRTKEEMPKKLIFKNGKDGHESNRTYEVDKWDLGFPVDAMLIDQSIISLDIWNEGFGYFPID